MVCYFNGFIKNFKKGAAGDLFYIIRSGSVRITKNNENFHYGNLVTNVTPREDGEFAFDTGNDTDLLPEIEVATLNSGDYFGECALLKEDKGCFRIHSDELKSSIEHFNLKTLLSEMQTSTLSV